MAIVCSAESLLASANCLTCLSTKQLAAIDLYIKCQKVNGNSVNCIAENLLAQAVAAGFDKLSEKQQLAVLAYLDCQLANSGGSPAVSTFAAPLTDGTGATFNIGATSQPQLVHITLLCTTNDVMSSLTVGQEIEAWSVIESTPVAGVHPFNGFWNGTAFLVSYDGTVGTTLSFQIDNVHGAMGFTSLNHFSIKVKWF